MARLPRLYIPGQPQLVMLHSLDGRRAFVDDADYNAFLGALQSAARRNKVAIHAWVLLPTGVQLLATPPDETALPRTMQDVGRQYVANFNRRYSGHGTLWQGRYRATVIEPERYFLLACRMIECAPVRASLVTEPDAYRWSSFHHHAGLARDPMVTDHTLFWTLGNEPFARQRAWQQLCAKPLKEHEVNVLMEATRKGWVAGGEVYRAWAARTANRRISPLPRGRPLKPVEVKQRESGLEQEA